MSLIKEFLNPIADFFGIPWWYVLLTASLVILAFRTSRTYFKTEKSDDQGLKGFLGFLRRLSRFTEIYHWGLLRCLRALDGWVGEPLTELHQSRQHPGWRRWLGSNPWTGRTYDFCLKLALLYPLLALLGFWGFTNNGVLGGVTLLEPALWWQRTLLFVALTVIAGLFWWGNRLDGWKSWLVLAFAFAGAFAVAFAFASAFAGRFRWRCRCRFRWRFRFAFARCRCRSLSLAFAVAGAFAVAVAVAWSYEWLLEHRPKMALIVRGVFWVLVFVAYVVVLCELGGKATDYGNAILLFLGVLPLLNVPLDWLSLGLTRGLLRVALWEAKARFIVLIRVGIWGLDIGLAFGLMFALVVVVIGGISLLNWSAIAGGGSPLIHLPHTLQAIEDNPTGSAHYWVYFLFFSTLVPTVFHLGVALFLGSLPPSVGHWIGW